MKKEDFLEKYFTTSYDSSGSIGNNKVRCVGVEVGTKGNITSVLVELPSKCENKLGHNGYSSSAIYSPLYNRDNISSYWWIDPANLSLVDKEQEYIPLLHF